MQRWVLGLVGLVWLHCDWVKYHFLVLLHIQLSTQICPEMHLQIVGIISRVSDQNGVSPLYIMPVIHHSGREPSIYNNNQLTPTCLASFPYLCSWCCNSWQSRQVSTSHFSQNSVNFSLGWRRHSMLTSAWGPPPPAINRHIRQQLLAHQWYQHAIRQLNRSIQLTSNIHSTCLQVFLSLFVSSFVSCVNMTS